MNQKLRLNLFIYVALNRLLNEDWRNLIRHIKETFPINSCFDKYHEISHLVERFNLWSWLITRGGTSIYTLGGKSNIYTVGHILFFKKKKKKYKGFFKKLGGNIGAWGASSSVPAYNNFFFFFGILWQPKFYKFD